MYHPRTLHSNFHDWTSGSLIWNYFISTTSCWAAVLVSVVNDIVNIFTIQITTSNTPQPESKVIVIFVFKS